MSEKEIQNKKILYLVTQTKWGGAQKYVLELAEYFSKNNEVHIGFGETEQKNQRFLDSCEKLNITTIPIKQLVRKIDPKKDLKTILEIGRVLSKNHYNLVHLNSSKAGLLGALAANKYNYNPLNIRVKIVYTAHGFVFNEPLSKLKKRIYKMSEKFSTNLQHAVITVSEFDKQSAIDNKICSPHKMFVVHNGLDFSKYDFLTREQAREELKLDYKTKYFGTIGSFYETKGYKYLIEAIKLLKNENSPLLKKHQWILIGDGPEKEDIVKRISDAQLQNFIKII